MPVVRRSVTLVNEQGLHVRPITRMLEIARRHQSRLTVTSGEVRADGRDLFQMLKLAAPHGGALEFDADGEDAEALVAALEKLVADRFGEG